MASSLDGWIHNFTVTDVRTHRKGFSVYKITSIVSAGICLCYCKHCEILAKKIAIIARECATG